MSNLHAGDEVNPQEAGRLMAEQAQRIIDRREQPRQPEANTEVYELGHYEQMHLEKALVLATTEDEELHDLLLETTDYECLEQLMHIFASGATVTIIRKTDKE